MANPTLAPPALQPPAGGLGLHGWLLAIWFVASFGVVFFARDLQMIVAGWPLDYWFAAQGSVFIFIAIVAVFAWVANRRDGPSAAQDLVYTAYKRRLHRKFATYVVCLLLFLLALALAERLGLKKTWVGVVF